MQALILLAQAFFNHQTRIQTEHLRQAGHRAALAGRRMALAGALFALGLAFIFSGILVALIDMGLQIDRRGSVSFSGLMTSAAAMVAIALAAFVAGWVFGREPRHGDEHKRSPEPPLPTFGAAVGSELRQVLEAVVITLLKEFLERHQAKPTSAQATKTPSPSNAGEPGHEPA